MLNSTIVSYPDRGNDGRNTYRGNCSGLLIEDLITHFKVQEISDYSCGSGTTEDVAKRLNIESHCYDLNRGYDLMRMEIPERNEFIFWHPAYWDIIKYAGEQFPVEEIIRKYGFDPRLTDLSRTQPYDNFVKEMNYQLMKQFASLDKGGRMAVLCGDIKKKGKLYSMLCDMVKPQMENIIIKAQHNCWSDSRSYSNNNFIPIKHEYLVILKKASSLIYDISLTVSKKADLRNLQSSTWKDVVFETLEVLGGSASLEKIYSSIDGHKKCESNPHWKDKVRQVLNQNKKYFVSAERGMWAIAA